MKQPIETQLESALIPGGLYVHRRATDGKRFNWDTLTWVTPDLEDVDEWKDISKAFTEESPNYFVIAQDDVPDEAVDRTATDLVFAKEGADPAPTDKCYGIFNSQSREVSVLNRTLGNIGTVHGVVVLPGAECAMPTVQRESVGVAIVVKMLDEDGDPIDLSTATALKIRLLFPDGTGAEYTADLYTDGADGALVYVTVEDDLEDVGVHKAQSFATVDGERKISTLSPFKVLPNIEVTPEEAP